MADPTEPMSVERFLQALERSGLLTQPVVRHALATAPADTRADAQLLADHFVRLGRLSHYQARKLLDGTPVGLVLGPYQIVMPIGRGGMGTVYLARDTRTPRLLALKVLPPKKARAEERLLARFQREMELSRRVAHPNLTQTYDVGEAEGVYYIAMEYIAGQSLYRLVSNYGPLPVGRAARLFAQVAAGLEHAHEQGLIHRDLKPSNIMITPRDQVKVLDLGLALIEGEVVEDHRVVGGKGYVVGTMDYIAPEQTEDAAAVDARSDLYAVGCSLYFALTGQPPFPGGDSLSKIRRHRKEPPPPLPELNPLVPAGFAALVYPLLAKRPEDRPQSAAVLRQQLLAWADPEPAGPPGAPPAPATPDAGLVEELEAEQAAADEESWDWMPAVSLAETARPERPLPAWWAEAGSAARVAVLAATGLAAAALLVLLWAALRG
jgi:serine/threonine protein kinase